MLSRIASAHTDHRRGLVLGLTMAEVLLLLLFLLLLALTSALATTQAEADKAKAELQAVQPILASLVAPEAHKEDVAKDIARRLAAAEAEHNELDNARRETAALRSQLSSVQSELQEWRDVATAARQIDPNAPPAATLRRALQEASANKQTQLTETQARTETVKDVVVAVRDTERRLGERLQQEFGSDLARWNASLDPSSLTLRFANPELLFETGSASLRPNFEAVLSNFIPRYLGRLQEFRTDIEEVRIEGHTSSEWRGTSDPLDAYFRNMGLNQDRTRTVLQYSMTRTTLPPDIRGWAQSVITANGLASSRLRLRPDGTEDPNASRRVEFRVLMKLRENVMRVVGGS